MRIMVNQIQRQKEEAKIKEQAELQKEQQRLYEAEKEKKKLEDETRENSPESSVSRFKKKNDGMFNPMMNPMMNPYGMYPPPMIPYGAQFNPFTGQPMSP